MSLGVYKVLEPLGPYLVGTWRVGDCTRVYPQQLYDSRLNTKPPEFELTCQTLSVRMSIRKSVYETQAWALHSDVHTHTQTCMFVCECVCVCVCVYVYIYIYIYMVSPPQRSTIVSGYSDGEGTTRDSTD